MEISAELLRSVAMAVKVIAQRELRNNIGQILRDAEAGTQFTITVRGRAVATLGPASEINVPRSEVDARTIAQLLRETPVDDGFAVDLRQLRELETPTQDPWPTT
jgi:prevent-host-death family protein